MSFHLEKNNQIMMLSITTRSTPHLQCILTLFSTRWGLIKAYFPRHIAKGERISQSREKRGERGLWQRRFWKHLIRDERDYRQQINHIHWDAVKHGWARCVKDWPR
jgi:putative transposase